MQNKPSESLEVLAAIVVTAGLVGGNMLLFAPLRSDNRVKPPDPPARTAPEARSAFGEQP